MSGAIANLETPETGSKERRSVTGEVAVIGPGLRERFIAGAFGDLRQADICLNYMHMRSRPLARSGAGLELVDSPECLKVYADMPKTRESEDALTLVRSGVLRGLSIEFSAIRERRVERVRQVESARLMAMGLVDSPAYAGSIVQVRGQALAEAIEQRQSGRAIVRQLSRRWRRRLVYRIRLSSRFYGGKSTCLRRRERLASFAEALGVDLSVLIEAANQDGAGYRAQSKRRRIWL